LGQHTVDKHVQQIILNRRLNVIEPGTGFWHILRGRLDGSKITGTDRVSRRIKFDYILRPSDIEHFKDMTDFQGLTPLSFLDRESSTDDTLSRWFDETKQFISIETPEPRSPRWIDLLAEAYRVYAPALSVYLPQIMIRYAGLEWELFEQILRYYGDKNKRTYDKTRQAATPSAFRQSLKRHYGWVAPQDYDAPLVFHTSADSDSASESGSSDDDDGVVRALIMAADGSMMNLSIDPDEAVLRARVAKEQANSGKTPAGLAPVFSSNAASSDSASAARPRISGNPSPLATPSSDKKYPFDWKSNAPRHYCHGHFAMSPNVFALPPRPVKAPPPVKAEPPPLKASWHRAKATTLGGWTKGKDCDDKGKGKGQEKGKFARVCDLDAARKGRGKGDPHDHAVLQSLETLAADVRRDLRSMEPLSENEGPILEQRADDEASSSQPVTEVEEQVLPWQGSSDVR